MKNIFFILSFIASASVAQAQVGVTVQAINADDVPAAVISGQATVAGYLFRVLSVFRMVVIF